MPRNERPSVEELETYTESRYEPDTDYTQVRRQLSLWLHDYRRDQELIRSEQQGKTLLLGHESNDIHEQRHGFDPETFDLNAVKKHIVSLH